MSKEILDEIIEYCNRCMAKGNTCEEEKCILYRIEQIVIKDERL